ncbi:MAG: hypothetical protein H7Z14_03660, partial [Anaerolineae bacterium]|nr:hypothetical protein [Phycisphaerae bacterium]
MRIEPDSNGALFVKSVTHKDGTATASSADTGEIILLTDWRSVDTNAVYSAESVGSVIAEYMKSVPIDGVRLAELPIHEMGLSRGTAMLDGLAKSLGRAGIWVDQISYMDPRPIFVMGDPAPIVYDNVAFADNYWRMDVSGEEAKSGMRVDGAYNLYQQFINDHADGYELVHLAPASYYIATINLNTHDGGEGPIYDDWFGNSADKPARDKTGFYYSN